MTPSFRHLTIVAGAAMVLASTSVEGQWSNAALFNSTSETTTDIKNPRLVGAAGGGVHGIYHGSGKVRYRRYTEGAGLGGIVDVHSGLAFNGAIAESLNGEIHIVLEDWAGDAPNVRWYKSANGGASFTSTQLLSSSNCAKHPHIGPYGLSGGEMLMSYMRSGNGGTCDKSLFSRRYNGSSWSGEVDLGSNAHSEYDCFGMARSPVDGTIYRSYDPWGDVFAMRRYNGMWQDEVWLTTGSWPVRQHMAINNSGRIMWVWDDTERIKSMYYVPGLGAGPVVDIGQGGYSGSCDITAIPGTDDFYMVVARGGHSARVYGRRWTGGAWQAEEIVNGSQALAFITFPTVTADVAGKIYCAYEYWGSNEKPQMWYTIRDSFVPPGPKGYVSGTVRDSYNVPLSNAAVSITGIGSAVTDGSGSYNLAATVGTHTVNCNKTFYNPVSTPGVGVTENNTTTVNFTLSTTPPAPIASVSVTAGNQTNQLNWTGPPSINYNGARIRYSTTGFPATVNDGTFLADVAGLPSTASSYTHNSLTNGTTYYYSVFAYFQDASRFYASGKATASGTPFGPADYDADGDVDVSDWGHVQTCLSGAFTPQTDPSCFDAMFDADNDVDPDDVAAWLDCYSGPGIPANPNCAD